MSKGSRVREILKDLYYDAVYRCYDETKDEHINQALSDLAEIVRGEKKSMTGGRQKYVNYEQRLGYNQAIDHIAKLFEKEV